MTMTNPIGLTKREHFAALILGGMYANPEFPALQFDSASKMAIDQADSLIEMLEISAVKLDDMPDPEDAALDALREEYYRPLYSNEFVKVSDRTDPLDYLQLNGEVA